MWGINTQVIKIQKCNSQTKPIFIRACYKYRYQMNIITNTGVSQSIIRNEKFYYVREKKMPTKNKTVRLNQYQNE